MKYILLYILIMTSLSLKAQDMHFSQYNSSPANLNPSLTGIFDGDYRIVLNNRNQWSSVTVPYKTFSAAADMGIRAKFLKNDLAGAGIVINSDKAGDSEFGTTQGLLSFAFRKTLDKDSTHFFSLGMQGGVTQRSINYSKLSFDDQYNGDYYDPNLSTGETFDRTSFVYFDLSSGINWSYTSRKRFAMNAGISLSHLNRPEQTFFAIEEVKLQRKTIIHAAAVYRLKKKKPIDLISSAMYEFKGKYKEMVLGSSVRYSQRIKNLDYVALYAGAHYRFSDAVILNVGMDYNNLNIGLSYDLNISDLRPASNGLGGFEISLIYIIRKFRPETQERKVCPPYM